MNTHSRHLAASLVGIAAAATLAGTATAGFVTRHPDTGTVSVPAHLSNAKICETIALPVDCETLPDLPADKRAALERQALAVLRLQTPEVRRNQARAGRDVADLSAAATARIASPAIKSGVPTTTIPYPRIPGVVFENGWRRDDHSNAWDIVVYAGHLTSDPSQGVLVRQASGDGIPNETYVELPVTKTPSGSGAARVADADGDLLTIALADGTRLIYDAWNGVFVE